MKIGYVGMSHLGLVSCVGTASKGFQVIGFDKNTELIRNLKNSNFPIEEPKFISLFESNKTKIEFITIKVIIQKKLNKLTLLINIKNTSNTNRKINTLIIASNRTINGIH